MKAIHKILVPTDFSEGARLAMREALDLAQTLGAEVTLLHAYQLPNYVLPDGSAIMVTAEAHAELVQSADLRLREQLEDALAWQVMVTTATRQGPAAEMIVDAAEQGNYDLVVMGTHGRTGFKRLLLGSVAEKVVRTCARPVLTIRQPRGEEATHHPPVL